jgi:hypothetical protein
MVNCFNVISKNKQMSDKNTSIVILQFKLSSSLNQIFTVITENPRSPDLYGLRVDRERK